MCFLSSQSSIGLAQLYSIQSQSTKHWISTAVFKEQPIFGNCIFSPCSKCRASCFSLVMHLMQSRRFVLRSLS
ncbi:hypothetical protein QJS04_geneDACA006049 [Acorus gramineus]|uniref:Uncharacterized protein n=1 Tax=Acorus gramineus TaxID=55184 RepID=A0AAV9B2F3_ACOGR|nr:hypothetical protein QJS04_geneDACA006049 [Acorus gramineus]